MEKDVEVGLGSFENPINIENFKELEKILLDQWVKINGRKELKATPKILGSKEKGIKDRQYTLSIEFDKSGIQLAVFNHYMDFLPFEGIDPLIFPVIKEVYRVGTGVAGASKLFKKFKDLGYKQNA